MRLVLAIFIFSVILLTTEGQNDGRYRPPTTKKGRVNDGRYTPVNDGRYRPNNDGKYRPENNGKYIPGNDGKYIHKDVPGGAYTGGGGQYTGGGGQYVGNKDKIVGGGQYTGSGDKYRGSGGSGTSGSGSGGSGGQADAGSGSDSGNKGSSNKNPKEFVSNSQSLRPSTAGKGTGEGKNGWKIIQDHKDAEKDGYYYLFETENGILAEESGRIEDLTREDEGLRSQGFYEYTGDDGLLYRVDYVADDRGFVPQGDHIPKTPIAIQKLLAYLATKPPETKKK